MSSVEQNPLKPEQTPGADQQSSAAAKVEGLKGPPVRPTLVTPPPRPIRPAQPKPTKPAVEATVATSVAVATAKEPAQAPVEEAIDPSVYRYLPIAPPSEPMQYRAIGLVRGTYEPTEADQLNRGNLTTEDGYVIDSVLLGRVTSLVKKHIDLSTPHLWVVYPRTRREMDANDDQDLHLQIVGVWEPETLGLPGESPNQAEATETEATEAETETEAAEAETEVKVVDSEVTEAETPASEVANSEVLESAASEAKATESEATESEATESEATKSEATKSEATPVAPAKPIVLPDNLPTVDDNFFSIRGEIVKHEPDDRQIMVKILQGVKGAPGNPKSFKLMLQGDIEGRTLGYFWDFKVKRDAKALVVQSAAMVGIVPPKKRPKGSSVGRRPPSRRPGGPRPSFSAPRPAGTSGSPRPRKPSPEVS